MQAPGTRPVQAPKVRHEPRASGVGTDRGRSRYWVIGSAALVVIVIASVLGATLLGGGKANREALAAAGCVQQTFPQQGRQHVPELPKDYKYNSFPPTSGNHFPVPAIWNIYEAPVEEIRLVHNLEHGGIIVQYGDQVPAGTADAIRAWYAASDRSGIIVAPYADLKDKVAFTAWTQLATCPGFSDKAADAFVALHRYKGPEHYPINLMQPGAQT